ncbi:MAG: hypothetical protein JXR37_12875 [Kiritimatiellae bacterium]|nr:hypothetical protein [Kiritimatiellia bacterium]
MPGGAYKNKDAAAHRLQIDPALDESVGLLACDPQISGGLALALPADRAAAFLRAARARGLNPARIGEFDRSGLIRLA